MHLLFLCMLARAAESDDSAPPEPEAARLAASPIEQPYEAPFEAVLDEAKRLYFDGQQHEALALFRVLERRVALGEEADSEMAAEAYIYLGEIQLLTLGDYEAATATFRTLLETNPDQPINPYHHPVDVVGLFEGVRKSVLRDRQLVPPTPQQPFPMWGYAPFGAPQFIGRQPVRGAVYATAQGAFGITSIAMYAHLRHKNELLTDPDLSREEYRTAFREVQVQRWLIQWPATFAFYATWMISVGDAYQHWSVTGGPLYGAEGTGLEVRVNGRF